MHYKKLSLYRSRPSISWIASPVISHSRGHLQMMVIIVYKYLPFTVAKRHGSREWRFVCTWLWRADLQFGKSSQPEARGTPQPPSMIEEILQSKNTELKKELLVSRTHITHDLLLPIVPRNLMHTRMSSPLVLLCEQIGFSIFKPLHTRPKEQVNYAAYLTDMLVLGSLLCPWCKGTAWKAQEAWVIVIVT